MTPARAVFAFAASALVAIGGALPRAQAPVRDRPAAFATGAGSISGVVVTAADRKPVRRATIVVTSSGPTRHAVTDEQGTFVIDSLPFAQYVVSASKPAYLISHYGSRRPGRGPGRPVVLSAAAPSAALSIELWKGGVITGTVTDANGRPAQNVRLTLLESRPSGGERVLVPAPLGGAVAPMTDDRGVYRVYGLAPGDYLVGAVPQTAAVPLTTAADIDRARALLRSSASAGQPVPSPTGPGAGPAVGYARIFFPGTPDPSGAVPVSVGLGEERGGVDFALQYVRAAKVAGVVTEASGAPAPQAVLSFSQPSLPSTMATWGVQRQRDGRFTIAGVTPGDYVLNARLSTPLAASRPAATGNAPGGDSRGGTAISDDVAWASVPVRVDGNDLEGLTLTLQPGMTLSGRLVLERGRAGNARWSALQVQLDPQTPGALSGGTARRAQVLDDGTFLFRGIVPGSYRFNVTGPLIATQVLLGGRDVADRSFRIGPGEVIENVTIACTDAAAQIAGRLLDGSGQPVAGLTVVLFTADRAFWGLQSRRTAAERPGVTGDFRFAALLPGEYYLSAVADFDPSDASDPTFYEALVPASLKVTVGPGATTTQDLRLAAQ